ncbi:MAG: glycosyltransferase [Candidatus Woesearchaeota archaeon]|nr:glycosyltransferase [Candidatus Woesearchaeota archaeon]
MKLSSVQVLYSALDVDYPGTHGGSTHVGEAALSLSTLCKHVFLLCKHSKGQPFLECRPNLTIYRFPIPSVSFLRVLCYFLYPFLFSLFLFFFRNISLVYERGRIFGGGAIVTGFLFRKKTVYELNEPILGVPVALGVFKKSSLLYTLLFAWHSFILRCSSFVTLTHKSSLDGISHPHVLLIHYGADPDVFSPQPPDPSLVSTYDLTPGKTLLYVGSFSRWHACDSLLRAFAQVVRHEKSAKLLMVGKGEQVNSLMSLTKRLRLTKSVFFVGKIPLKEVPKYINASDICFALFDRNYLPFQLFGYYYSPIKLHEYKSCGKTVIASDYPQLRELVKNDFNGYTVCETDIPELQKTIRSLLQRPQLLKKMGAYNRREVLRKYTWDKFNLTILEKIFKQ